MLRRLLAVNAGAFLSAHPSHEKRYPLTILKNALFFALSMDERSKISQIVNRQSLIENDKWVILHS